MLQKRVAFQLFKSLLLAAALAKGGVVAAAEPVKLLLAEGGVARLPVVIASNAQPRVERLAGELTNLLQRITGASFPLVVATGTAPAGIVLTTPGEFANLPADIVFNPEEPLRREEYQLRTHRERLWIAGATDIAVSHAVWGLLDQLGYRLYFPTDTWEVVPQLPRLELALDLRDAPDFHTRQAPRGAPWGNRNLWQRWRERNRVVSAFKLNTGHAYGGVIRRNRKEFEAHPEYFALIDGERRIDGKFCISNPGLRQLVVDFAVKTIAENPDQDSLSLDPSDGGGWCECEPCVQLGSVSDRVLLLANEAAAAINALGLGPKYVGIYAYNQHSPPPTIDVHPNVVVSVATSFIRGGYKLSELIEGWSAHKATLGIRDYHDVHTWSHDMPRRASGGKLSYLKQQIPWFYQSGARFMNSENSDSWGANGLGYWISPRLLWRVAESNRIDELVTDFVTNSFGPAAMPMREFYRLLNEDSSMLTAEHVVGSMYRQLAQARALAAGRSDVMARLDDLVLYTRYCELYHAYRGSAREQRQAGFEAVWRHVYRMRDRMMLSTISICHRGRYRDKSVVLPEGAEWHTPEGEHPWKESTPYTAAELEAMVAAGCEANQLVELDFEPATFSENLVPAGALAAAVEAAPGVWPPHSRGSRKFYLWLNAPGAVELGVTGGLIQAYRDRGNVKLHLFAAHEVTLEAVAEDESVVPDGVERKVKLASPHDGLHTLEMSDGGDMTALTWPDELIVTLPSSEAEQAKVRGYWSLYCYVPRGTRVVGGYATTTRGCLRNSKGEEAFNFNSMKAPGYFSVPVPEDEAGSFWMFDQCSGERMLMTIPPCLALHPRFMLLPEEVVERDQVK